MQIKNILEKIIGEALKSLSLPETGFVVEHPTDLKMGDYSTNAGIKTGKSKEIFDYIKQKLPKEIEKAEIAGPGFINFYLSKDFFVDTIKQVVKKKEGWGKNKNLKGQKIIVEHTQPNPFKEFHIGHLMNNAIGESIARILKASGAKVKTASYHGDKGLHVAKAVWALNEGIEFEKAYAYGNKAYEEDENAKQEITLLNKVIYDETDKKVNEVYEKGKTASLKHFESIYENLGSNFDFHFFESDAGEIGKDLVLKNEGKVFEKSENAIVFQGENFEPKTHTRVFLNREELPTYEAEELGLA